VATFINVSAATENSSISRSTFLLTYLLARPIASPQSVEHFLHLEFNSLILYIMLCYYIYEATIHEKIVMVRLRAWERENVALETLIRCRKLQRRHAFTVHVGKSLRTPSSSLCCCAQYSSGKPTSRSRTSMDIKLTEFLQCWHFLLIQLGTIGRVLHRAWHR